MSVARRSATPGPRSTSAIRGPPATFSSAAGRPPPTSSSHSIFILGRCGTAKTTNKVPTSVKQEEPEVPNKDPKGFQTLKLSAQSSFPVAPDAQKPSIVTGPLTPKAKQMPVRRGDVIQGTSIPTQPAYTTGRPIAMLPGPDTNTGPRQLPTPPPSGVVEPPEMSSDQAKVKFWRDRALQAEARLQEREHQIRQQSQEILDLSWKAKVAADWTQWWEHHSHEFTPLPHERSSTDRRQSRSRSVSTSVTRRTGRSVTPSQGSRRSVTPTRRGRVGPGPLGGLGEETLQEMEALEEYTLDSIAEPTSQEVMVRVTGYDRDDLEGHLPWASRLEHAELVEMARRRRREILGGDYPKEPIKDGWLGPVPPEARDNESTLLHNVRWWFFPCKRGSLPPFRYDGAIDAWRKTVLAFSNDRIYIMQRDDPMSYPSID